MYFIVQILCYGINIMEIEKQILLNVVTNLAAGSRLGSLLIQIFQKYFFC